jgi:broad specificity phosphatase PhoE
MAARAAQEMADVRPAAVVTSPIQRCRETADILAEQWNVTPVVDRAFIEADYGSWSGRKLTALYRLKAWGSLMSAASRFRFPDGESLEDVQRRAIGAIERLSEGHRANAAVVVVSHADVIRSVLAHYLGMPLDLIHRLHVGPASASLVMLPKAGPPAVPVVNARGGRV